MRARLELKTKLWKRVKWIDYFILISGIILLCACQTVPKNPGEPGNNNTAPANAGLYGLSGIAGIDENIWEHLDPKIVETAAIVFVPAVIIILILAALTSAARKGKQKRRRS